MGIERVCWKDQGGGGILVYLGRTSKGYVGRIY